jgi:hypothetical protein
MDLGWWGLCKDMTSWRSLGRCEGHASLPGMPHLCGKGTRRENVKQRRDTKHKCGDDGGVVVVVMMVVVIVVVVEGRPRKE